MKNKIGKNFYLAAVRGGKVVAYYFSQSLAAIAEVKSRHPGCDVEAFDVHEYGFDFGDAPVINVEGGPMLHRVRCRETGKVWQSVKQCCKEIGMPLKTMYTALRRGSRVFGHHYDYFED
jgi:hypothetical protein